MKGSVSRRRHMPVGRVVCALATALAIAAGLAAVCLATAPRAAASTTYWPLLRFGVEGSLPGQFELASPDGIAVDAVGNIYCTDPGNGRVEKFTSAGKFVCLIGDTDGLDDPYGLAVAANGTVYVMDTYKNRVREYTPSAGGTAYAVAGGWSLPAASGMYAHGICTDTASPCHVYVADGPNNEVLEYASDSSGAATPLFTIGGGPGSGTSQFSDPEDVAAAWSGGTCDLYVSDAGNERVVRWHYDGTSWAYAATVISSVSLCNDPKGIDVDSHGDVYYADFGKFVVHRYDPSASGYTLAATFGTGLQVDRGNAGFHFPWGVAVSASGARIYVGDTDCEVHVLTTDTTRPTTVAYAASVKHDRTVTLHYKVRDAAPSCGRAKVVLLVYRGSKLARRLSAGSHTTNSLHWYRWKCTLAKGSYTIRVYATDAAGNRQSKIGRAPLTVH